MLDYCHINFFYRQCERNYRKWLANQIYLEQLHIWSFSCCCCCSDNIRTCYCMCVCLSVHVRIIVCYTYEHLPIYNGMLVTAHFAVIFLCSIYSSFICFVVILYLFFLLIMWTGQRQKFWICFFLLLLCIHSTSRNVMCSGCICVSFSSCTCGWNVRVQSDAREYRTIVEPRNCALFIYFYFLCFAVVPPRAIVLRNRNRMIACCTRMHCVLTIQSRCLYLYL